MDIKKVITLAILGVLSLNSSVFAYDPLFDAIFKSDPEKVKDILQNFWLLEDYETLKQVVNEKNNVGYTPLIYAILSYSASRDEKERNELKKIVKLLVEYGADVNIHANVSNFSPLYYAVVADDEELFQLLLDKKANIDSAILMNGNTLLIHFAAGSFVAPKWIYLILKNKANINAQNNNGVTALMRAVTADNVEIVRVLRFAGADTTITDNNGDTALDITNQENNRLTNDLNNAILLNDLSEINRLQNELKKNNEIIKILQMKFEKRESKKDQ